MSCETTILLVDDHAMMRKGLRMLIEREGSFSVIGEAGDGREAIELVQQLKPDIVVMDINMPHLNGIDATREILSHSPHTHVLALSIHSGKEYVEGMLAAGAEGYLLKENAPEELIRAIQALANGKSYLSAEITDIVINKARQQNGQEGENETGSAAHSRANKLHKPPLPEGLVHRRELIERLERGRDKKMSLLVAPEGYGKSTLVCDWLKDCQQPHAWWSLDNDDDDLHRFLTFWIAALNEISPTPSKYLAPLVEAANLPPVSILAGALIADLEALPHAFIFVLDNLHLVKEKSIHDLLSQVLRSSADTVHLVLICRQDPFLPITALRVDNMVNEIRMEDLMFSSHEIKTFLETALGTPVDDETVSDWEKRTAGWVTGLRLAIHTLGPSDEVEKKSNKDERLDWREVLTNREFEVLLLLQKRLRDKEIADQLCISTETVKSHLKNLYSKLHATDRRDVVVKAEKLQLLR